MAIPGEVKTMQVFADAAKAWGAKVDYVDADRGWMVILAPDGWAYKLTVESEGAWRDRH